MFSMKQGRYKCEMIECLERDTATLHVISFVWELHLIIHFKDTLVFLAPTMKQHTLQQGNWRKFGDEMVIRLFILSVKLPLGPH